MTDLEKQRLQDEIQDLRLTINYILNRYMHDYSRLALACNIIGRLVNTHPHIVLEFATKEELLYLARNYEGKFDF